MSSLEEYRLKLLARNEGKIKSHESCFDIRAWSHDVGTRDRYLREWIKCDMPFCLMPLSNLASVLRNMTCKNRGRATPRCHRDCKSKAILDSICASCHAMRDCLKSDENYEKFFIEEELETSHWPCERCLEALKSIKMFWNVIVEKLFNINVPKNEAKVHIGCCRTNSIRDMAKMWERDMVQQAMFIKTATTPRLSNCPSSCTIKTPSRKGTCCRITKRCSEGDRGSTISQKNSRITIPSKKICPNTKCPKHRVTTANRESNCNLQHYDKTQKICRCTSVRVKGFDVGCNTSGRREWDDVKAYKTNLEYLQNKYNEQKEEMDKLKRENASLKIELQNVYKNGKWKSPFFCPAVRPDNSNVALVPKPFECCIEENKTSGSAKDADSEMIITMKNCRNETFRHVSLLQVLHKTNDPLVKEINLGGPCYKKQNPIDLLTKVQNTLGEMVKREMSMASRRQCGQTSDIEATYHRINPCKSVPSCSTVPSRCALG